MLRTQAYPSIGRLTYSFDGLYCRTRMSADVAEARPVYGFAVIAYDGRGNWWVETITCHHREFGKPDFTVDRAHPLWREIAQQLASLRDEAITDAINEALGPKGGVHMAIFGEQLPPETVRRAPPPYVPAGFRRRAAATPNAAVQCFEFLALVLLLGSILALGTLVQMPWPGHQGDTHAPAIAFARLDGASR